VAQDVPHDAESDNAVSNPLADKRKRGYGKTVTPWSIVVGNERFERSAFGSGGRNSIPV